MHRPSPRSPLIITTSTFANLIPLANKRVQVVMTWLARQVNKHLPGLFGIGSGSQGGLNGTAHIAGADRFQRAWLPGPDF